MVEITETLLRKLIHSQFPEWEDQEICPVKQSGHDNRTFHLGEKMTVRLPSGPEYVAQIEKEAKWLPFLRKHLSLPISDTIAVGQPDCGYPFPWSVNRYIEGVTVSRDKVVSMKSFAEELARFLEELQRVPAKGAPEAGQHNFFRGASPAVYHEQVETVLRNPENEWSARKLKAIWEKAVSSQWQHPPVWIHGDVAPGNLLVKDGHLCGVIDFGIMGIGDPACDYAMAWTFFDSGSRAAFLRGLDSMTVDRARGWALWKALITCSDGDRRVSENARLTIQRILEEWDKEETQ